MTTWWRCSYIMDEELTGIEMEWDKELKELEGFDFDGFDEGKADVEEWYE